MSGQKVDVLFIMRECAAILGASKQEPAALRLLDAHDCMAELIEAAQDVIDDTVDASTYPDGPCISRTERAALTKALANIGPTP